MLHPALVAALALAAVAAATDARTGRIPNWLTLPVLALAPLVHLLTIGWFGLAASLLGLTACAVLPVLLFRKGALGGGDVKLFAALGAVVGASPGFQMQLAAFVAGALIALVRVSMRGGLRETLRRTGRVLLRRPVERSEPLEMRFGPAILLGTAVVSLFG